MDEVRRIRLADTFCSGAAEYDTYRPEYPDELFEVIEHEADDGLSHVLEVGAGTGRATLPLARRGARIEAVEPSADMLCVLSGRLEAEGLASRVMLRRATFEEVDPHTRSYGAVVAAQSFHWADPATRWRRLSALLRPGGQAFLFWNNWVIDTQRHDADAIRDTYSRWGQSYSSDLDADRAREPGVVREIEAEPTLARPQSRYFVWPWQLPVDHYFALLTTTSQYAVTPAPERERLFDALREVLGDTVQLRGNTLLVTTAGVPSGTPAR